MFTIVYSNFWRTRLVLQILFQAVWRSDQIALVRAIKIKLHGNFTVNLCDSCFFNWHFPILVQLLSKITCRVCKKMSKLFTFHFFLRITVVSCSSLYILNFFFRIIIIIQPYIWDCVAQVKPHVFNIHFIQTYRITDSCDSVGVYTYEVIWQWQRIIFCKSSLLDEVLWYLFQDQVLKTQHLLKVM